MGLVQFIGGYKFVQYSSPSEYRTKRGTSPMGDGLDFTDWCAIGDAWRGWMVIADWMQDAELRGSMEWFYPYIDEQQRWHMGGRTWDREQAVKTAEPEQLELTL